MMSVSALIISFLILCEFSIGRGSLLVDDPQSSDTSDLMARSFWAEQLSLSLFPPYSSPDHRMDPNMCIQLLHEFANNSADLSSCLAGMAWPVRVCQYCYKEYAQLKATMDKITSHQNSSTLGCETTLLRSDRVQVIVALYNFYDDLWIASKCASCVNKNYTDVMNTTAAFMKVFDELMQCFNITKGSTVPDQNGNFSHVCQMCNVTYKNLSDQYTNLEHGSSLCIDLEDAMNSTRSLWSREFNCTLPCTDTIPVVAVSIFILFLPAIFYFSTYLHSDQRKRKLILPKRLKSKANLAHIQDKSN